MTWSDFGFLGELGQLFFRFASFLYDWFSNVFTMTIADFLTEVVGLTVPEWGFLDTTIGVFLFGSGLTVYLGYQLITWILNVAP